MWEVDEEGARRFVPLVGASFGWSRSFGAGVEDEVPRSAAGEKTEDGEVATARAGEDEVEEEGAGRSTA